ncbi:MAG: hypothetical protein U5N58_07175 [Actinomycetota bacterium]|nr:hypothetical protein [Actinomycetota bacterium]
MNFHKKELGGISSVEFLKKAGADILNWVGIEAKSPEVEVRTYKRRAGNKGI